MLAKLKFLLCTNGANRIYQWTNLLGPADLLVAAGATTRRSPDRPGRLQLCTPRRISSGKKTIRRLASFNFLRRRCSRQRNQVKGAVLADK